MQRFVSGGGLLKEGSDPPNGMAALLLHQGMAMDVEAAHSKYDSDPSCHDQRRQNVPHGIDHGSVEVGKIADLTIVDGDPLKESGRTTNVRMVVKDGKRIDPAFTGP